MYRYVISFNYSLYLNVSKNLMQILHFNNIIQIAIVNIIY